MGNNDIMLSNNSQNNLVSAKRRRNERSGVHSWHPYYAGYAEAFVESAIKYLDLDEKDLVLDPWNGSGTTALVCSRNGINSIGFDVNEAMNIFSMAKTSVILESKELIMNAAIDICSAMHSDSTTISSKDPLLDFVSKSLCRGIRTIHKQILKIDFNHKRLNPKIKTAFTKNIKHITEPKKCFLLAALLITSRKLAGYKGGSNPTWIKKLNFKPPVKKQTLTNAYLDTINNMFVDLQEAGLIKQKQLNHVAHLGNSKNLIVKDNSIDAVITSPPYLTRIDYAMSTRPELLLLNQDENIRKIREDTMGAPIIFDKSITPQKAWGNYCNSILDGVKNHSSKAASTYYYLNLLQYFRDAEISIKQIIRVLKPGSRALVVVQSSYFKEIEINLGLIYQEMSALLGANSRIIFKEIVRGHMAHLNKRSNEYKNNKVFYEEVVEIRKKNNDRH